MAMSSSWRGVSNSWLILLKKVLGGHAKRASYKIGGYTVIEVMIVLAVTGVLFSSAVLMFQGQQGKTSISQSLYDLASKIETYSTEVNSGVYPDSQNFTCSVDGSGHPVLSGGSGGTGTNQSCLFLGRALQIVPNSSSLYAYSVLGDRTIHSGGADTNQTVTSFDQASPTPAQDNGGGWLLYDTYNLPSNETFSMSKVTDINNTTFNNYDLIGLYIDLDTATASSSTNSLSIRGYNFPNGGANAALSASVKNCIQQNAPCGTSSYSLVRSWVLCVQDGTSTGMVTVTTTPSGVSTAVDAQECK